MATISHEAYLTEKYGIEEESRLIYGINRLLIQSEKLTTTAQRFDGNQQSWIKFTLDQQAIYCLNLPRGISYGRIR
ncbi:hypothetical protein DPMN_094105 [Dreissena polymorpha]|uniref:Uncharacterized protein n=1 Tax=Dreissena polymorpha TaxID=45954 RepID=A0A9D4R2D4_DREPO|nr:hypothetical protein DPMN_094105 [Dreissena polymorpha]